MLGDAFWGASRHTATFKVTVYVTYHRLGDHDVPWKAKDHIEWWQQGRNTRPLKDGLAAAHRLKPEDVSKLSTVLGYQGSLVRAREGQLRLNVRLELRRAALATPRNEREALSWAKHHSPNLVLTTIPLGRGPHCGRKEGVGKLPNDGNQCSEVE